MEQIRTVRTTGGKFTAEVAERSDELNTQGVTITLGHLNSVFYKVVFSPADWPNLVAVVESALASYYAGEERECLYSGVLLDKLDKAARRYAKAFTNLCGMVIPSTPEGGELREASVEMFDVLDTIRDIRQSPSANSARCVV